MKKNYKKALIIILLLLMIFNTRYYDKIYQTNTDGSAESSWKTTTQAESSDTVQTLKRIEGDWKGAEYDLGAEFYTAYWELQIQDRTLETMDWQACNTGFKAQITDIDQEYIYFKVLEADGYPADWQLKTQDKIRYEIYSKDELRLKYHGTTCVFYRANDVTKAQTKKLKHLVGIQWIGADNSNVSVSFSYFDMEVNDAAKPSDDKRVFSGRMYFNEKNSSFELVPDITIVKEPNPIWTGMEQEKIAAFQYRLSEGGKVLTLTYDGKEAVFMRGK